jgi:hypothetical protein
VRIAQEVLTQEGAFLGLCRKGVDMLRKSLKIEHLALINFTVVLLFVIAPLSLSAKTDPRCNGLSGEARGLCQAALRITYNYIQLTGEDPPWLEFTCPCYSPAELVAAFQGNTNSCGYDYWTDCSGYDGFYFELGDSGVDTFANIAHEYKQCGGSTEPARCHLWIEDDLVAEITLDTDQFSQCQAVIEWAAYFLGLTCE